MGDPKKSKKKYKSPKKPWDKTRLEEERKLCEDFGLKNKKELWVALNYLKKKRNYAKYCMSLSGKERDKKSFELINSLINAGILNTGASLDDVFNLNTRDILGRRFQTIIFKKELANTLKQARQFITHGHIAIGNKRNTAPSYLVKRKEEEEIGFYKKDLIEKINKGEKKLKKEFEEAGKEKQEKVKQETRNEIKNESEQKQLKEKTKEKEKIEQTSQKKSEKESKAKVKGKINEKKGNKNNGD